jgi:hypothetical protein
MGGGTIKEKYITTRKTNTPNAMLANITHDLNA